MSKQLRNYTDFQNFVRQNSGLTRTQIYQEYKKQGGKIGKKKALDIIRDMWKIQKGEKKRVTKKQLKRNNFLNLGTKKNIEYRDLRSPAVQVFKKNIEKLYGTEAKLFIQVKMTVEGDGYTTEVVNLKGEKRFFHILIPFKNNYKPGIKTVGEELLKNLGVYYSNLAKMYNSLVNVKESVLDKLSALKKQFNKAQHLDEQGMLNLFSKYGFDIERIHLFGFTEK